MPKRRKGGVLLKVRPSVYRASVRFLRKYYRGDVPPEPIFMVSILRDNYAKPWRKEGFQKPNVREAVLAAGVFAECWRRENGRGLIEREL